MSPHENLQAVIADLHSRAVIADNALRECRRVLEGQHTEIQKLRKSANISTRNITIMASLLIAQSMWILLQ